MYPQFWREAATLVIAAGSSRTSISASASRLPNSAGSSQADDSYKVLFLQRSMKSKFMPGAFVFPGGVLSQADYSKEWEDIYRNGTGFTIGDIERQLRVDGPRPPMLSLTRNWPVPADVAFRICAIRETFEESGVLIVRSVRPNESHSRPTTRATSLQTKEGVLYGEVLELSGDQSSKYRQKIRKDAGTFSEMCKELDVVPDVWALHEWSNWLTPVHPTAKPLTTPPARPHRFDTLFYFCCLNDIPHANHDEQETVTTKWVSPAECHGKIKAFGPQFWELKRLANFSSLPSLGRYASSRGACGLERWMTVHIFCTDGVLGVRPGDDLYPVQPDYEGRKKHMRVKATVDEMKARTSKWNRFETFYDKLHRRRYQVNITLPYQQVAPLIRGVEGKL